MPELLVGVDVGTASSKGVLTRTDGSIVATASRQHRMSLPQPGHAEMDAEEIWWSEVASICRELTAQVGDRAVGGVAVSGIGPCLLPTDEHLRALRPGILYGIDSRASAEIDELEDLLGRDAILARAGKALSSQAIGPKLWWLRHQEPQVWERTRRWFSSSSYVVARLSGEYVLDHHTASQCDPLYDLREQTWAADWAETIVGDLPLPRLAWPTEVVGAITAEAAVATGLPVGTPVTAGTVDAWAESFSCGVRRPGDLMLMYGSTMFFVQVTPTMRTHPLLWSTTGVEPGSLTLAAGMATSGSLTAWVQELTGEASFAALVEEAAQVPPGSDGLLLLPYFAGERTPIFDPRARGVLVGLSLRHRRGHLYRAVYEGIAFGVRQILALLEETGGPPARVVSVGGGTQGGLWTQIVSDVTGLVQQIPEQTLGACYGDALMAGIGCGAVAPSTDWTTLTDEVHPEPAHRGVYDELYESFGSLYPATREQVHRLARLQEAAPADRSRY